MNTIKLHLIYFLIFVHDKYIYEDFNCMKPLFANIFLKPAWFVKSILKWILIFLFFPFTFARYYYNDKIEKIKDDAEKFKNEVLTFYYNK